MRIEIKNAKKTTLMICVLFVICSLFSTIFIFTHIGHEHDNDGPHGSCAVCVCISTVENLLRSLFNAFLGSALAFGSFIVIHLALKENTLFVGTYSLVHMKVKMSN